MDGTVDTTAADALADGCRLGVDAFGAVYGSLVAGTDAKPWVVLAIEPANMPATDVGRRNLFRSACREALHVQLLLEFGMRLAGAEVALGVRAAAEADALVAALSAQPNAGGRMEAIVEPGTLLERETLDGLLKVDAATALVYRGPGKPIGTAFLVGRDLVLTAAHVVMGSRDGAFVPELAAGLSFSFLVYEGLQRRGDPVTAELHPSKPLVAWSLPWGKPPDVLFVPPAPGSTDALDFALVRLDRQVTHVKPLDIREPPKPQPEDGLLVLGFAGGTATRWGVGTVAAVSSERMQHKASARSGMSGSCCINVRGDPVGLHEGSLSPARPAMAVGGRTDVVNRAVCLTMIRGAMRAGAVDPLLLQPRAPGFAIHDEALVRRWVNAGLRLAPADRQPWWRSVVKSAIGLEPDDIAAFPAFHPWFWRKDFEDWVDKNVRRTAGSADRLCIVAGPDGCGKSFLATILRETLDEPQRDMVALSATQTTLWSWDDALARMGVAAGRERDVRPEDAGVRHVDVPAAAAAVAGHGGRDLQAQPTPLFVVIDFEGNASFASDGSPWLLFMQELLNRAWVRLVVIGAPPTVTNALELSTFRDGNEQYTVTGITLKHIGQVEFQRFANLMLRQSKGRVDPAELAKAMNMLATVHTAELPDELRTVSAVLAGVKLQGLGL